MARKSSTLILKNLNESVDIGELLNTFKPFGELRGIRIRPSKKDKAIIFGFIEYKTTNDATKAIEDIRSQASPFKIKGTVTDVDYAHPQFVQRTQNHQRKFSATVSGLSASEIGDHELVKQLGCLKLDQRNNNIVAYYKTQEALTKAKEQTKMINGKKVSLI
ncbi:Polyadenylate-binding protein, cytoplasmic and nuclear [Cucumispora dikerogammari]|nr:Polyadenylate-binding protein, cytoplasmic and nuclear [Cucumispora dikerogammari]